MSKRKPEQTIVTYFQTAPLVAADVLLAAIAAIVRTRHEVDPGELTTRTTATPIRHRKARTPRVPRHEAPPLVERPQ